jgi:E3 ubiquitin-protein ligase RNF115/126
VEAIGLKAYLHCFQIEEGNDPRDNTVRGDEHDDDDADSMPDLEEAPYNMHPLHDHNPWQDDDPDDSDISTMRFQPTGPGRFHVSATIHRNVPPTAFAQNGNGPNTIGGMTSFLTNLLQGQAPRSQNQPQSAPAEGQGNTEPRAVPDGQPHVHRWTYTSGVRLQPRDGDNPGPRIEPVDDLNR